MQNASLKHSSEGQTLTQAMPRVSVVVPTFNRCESLQRLLEALETQTYPATDFEVVVVDDGSTDGTNQMLEQFASRYVLRALWQANAGPAMARNRGVSAAHGALIVFLDDLVAIDGQGPDWLRYRTTRPDQVNPALLARAARAGHAVVTLEQVPRSLEEIYLQVVQEEPATGAGGQP